MQPVTPKHDDQADLPTHFGKYTVVRELGRGAMGLVLEARHPDLGTSVALKVMQPSIAARATAAARFLREAKAASQIRHENVVAVFDVGTQDDLPFIVMEFLDGSDLAGLLAQRGEALPLSEIVDIFLPVCSAVHSAHRLGIIHRDLKPANLMITQRCLGRVSPKVLDFGISKLASEDMDSTLTRSESLLGTVRYMAPELTKGAKFASAMSDQYALGVMLYECATGQRPFTGDSHYELMHAIVTAPVTPPSQIQPTLPAEFDALVLRAMDRLPAKRFPSIEALGSALLSFGSRAAWALWEGEFIYSSEATGEGVEARRVVPPHRSGPTTLVDGTSLPDRARRSRWGVASLGLYAAVVTVMLGRAAIERKIGENRVASSPVHAPTSSGAAVTTETSNDFISKNLNSSAAATAQIPIQGAADTQLASRQPARAPIRPSTVGSVAPRLNRVGKASDHATKTIETKDTKVSSSPASSDLTKTLPLVGANGAPIFD
jgi:serine/threonine protein kinase